jgi:ribonuclease HI
MSSNFDRKSNVSNGGNTGALYMKTESTWKTGTQIKGATQYTREHGVGAGYGHGAGTTTDDDDEECINDNRHAPPKGEDADLAEEDDPSHFTLSPEQELAAQSVLRGKRNVFLTGAAGTGKSYLLRYIISRIRTKRRRNGLFVTATTGVAAENVKGTTVHSYAGIGLGNASKEELLKFVMGRPPAVGRWKDTKYLVIDEVSMLHAELFEKLEFIARKVRQDERPFGGVQLILCGDFFQLPPVERRGKDVARYAFQSPVWGACGIETLTLQQVQRQSDNRFITLLNEIRLGDLSERSSRQLEACHTDVKALPNDGILPTRLYCLNRNVDAENQFHLDRLPAPDCVYTGDDQWQPRNGEEYSAEPEDAYRKETVKFPGGGRTKADILEDLDRKCPIKIRLRVGAQVMYTKNDPARNLVNGSRGVVTECGNGPPKVLFDNKQVLEVKMERTAQSCRQGRLIRMYLPLKLAWAMTVHKSQGMTLTRAELQLDNAFEVGQVYVALSRVKSLEGLYLRGGRITAPLVRVDAEVLLRFGRGAAVVAAPAAAMGVGMKADPAGPFTAPQMDVPIQRQQYQHYQSHAVGFAEQMQQRVKAEGGAGLLYSYGVQTECRGPFSAPQAPVHWQQLAPREDPVEDDQHPSKRVKAESSGRASGAPVKRESWPPFYSTGPPSPLYGSRAASSAVVDLITPATEPLWPEPVRAKAGAEDADPFARLVAQKSSSKAVPRAGAAAQRGSSCGKSAPETVDLCSPVKVRSVLNNTCAVQSYELPRSAVTASARAPARATAATAKSGAGSVSAAATVDHSSAVLYFDGGSLGNPGVGGAGCLLYQGSGAAPHQCGYKDGTCLAQAAVRMDGVCTNNQAEYTGLIHGLHAALRLGVRELWVYGDSELVVKQMKREYRVKNPVLQSMHTRAAELAGRLGSVHYAWIERARNDRADALSKRAMLQRDKTEEAADWFRPS